MKFDSDDDNDLSDADPEQDGLIADIKAFPANGPYSQKQILAQRIDAKIASIAMPADKAECLENILSGTLYSSVATELVIPPLSEIYPGLINRDQQVQCAYYVAQYAHQNTIKETALDHLAESYDTCSSNESRINALSMLLKDPRNAAPSSDTAMLRRRFEKQQDYFAQWQACYDEAADKDKANHAIGFINDNFVYDAFKLNVLNKVYHTVSQLKNPLRQVHLIMVCNSKPVGARTQIENYLSYRMDEKYWPDDPDLDWRQSLRVACQKAVAEKGLTETLEFMKERLDKYLYEPWVKDFYAKVQNDPAILKDPEAVQPDLPPQRQLAMHSQMKKNFVWPIKDMRYDLHKSNPNMN